MMRSSSTSLCADPLVNVAVQFWR